MAGGASCERRPAAAALRRPPKGREITHATVEAGPTDEGVEDDLVNNATLTAMLVYLAAREGKRVDRERSVAFPQTPFTDELMSWPECEPARRSRDERRR